jgi:hypothetical protein
VGLGPDPGADLDLHLARRDRRRGQALRRSFTFPKRGADPVGGAILNIEELGGPEEQLPVPNSSPQSQENQEYSYVYLGFTKDGAEPPRGRWTDGKSIDGNGSFSLRPMEPQGREPNLGPARENSGAQSAEIKE